ncbi:MULTISPECIES: fused response regulator/phosphatase [unclassified Oleiphilus]|nr:MULTISPECIES: fused response regulator/phosphatase [unclassified Oleiphilus]
MNVLIVDDHESNRILVRYLLESEGHDCIEAENGQIAVEQFDEHQPDFVLMDIVMPVMDGYEAASLIKKRAGDTHVPIIFLTAKHDEKSLLACLESGGDDYLPKPINGIVLKAKIKAHARTQELTQQVHAKNSELTRLHATLTQEHEMGRHVLNHTLKRSLQNCKNVKSYLSSMSTFNGDIFLLAENPSGGLYAFLGDFTGHGLAAAIGTIPVSQAFFSMCEKSMPIMEIASSMNKSLKSFLPEYMFCAATLIHVPESGDKALVWAGGLPDAYITRPGEGLVSVVKSRHMPLGIVPAERFNSEIELHELRYGDKLFMFTDGILEGSPTDSDEMFGEERVMDSLDRRVKEGGQERVFDGLLDDYHSFSQGSAQQDDISLVEITAGPIDNSSVIDLEPKTNLPWSVNVDLDAERIHSQPDPIVQVIKVLPADLFLYRRADMIRTILSELYFNSLEHGLLALDSTIKGSHDGFTKYYQQRQERMDALDAGRISISVSFDYERSGSELKISLRDTGKGFDFASQNEDLAMNTKPWGRGIALVRSLCETVEYSDEGRCVEATLALNPNDRKERYPPIAPA